MSSSAVFSVAVIELYPKGDNMKFLKYYIVLVIIMFMWGFNVPIVKMIVESVSPVTITSLRIFVAGVSVFVILSFLKIVRLPTRREWTFIMLGTVMNVVCHHFFLAVGLERTTSSNAGIILGTGPILTFIIATIVLRQRSTVWKWLGFLLGSTGVTVTVLVGGNGVAGMSIGDLYIFLSIFTQAFSFIVINKAAKSLDPRLLTGYMLVIGSIVLFLISLVLEPGGLKSLAGASTDIWLLFFASAILATAIGHMTYNFTIGKIGPSEASIFLNLPPVFTLVGSALMLGETITIAHMIGLLFIVSGVILVVVLPERLKTGRVIQAK